jgi:hypothetical protein
MDTAGCMLNTQGISIPRLTQLMWTAEVLEYETGPIGPLRIEFNRVGFMGTSGIMYVGAMIQNVGHQFLDDAVGSARVFPALGLYFSSLQPTFTDSQHGVQLNATPGSYPQFGRVFENVDNLGYSAKNVYTRQGVGTPTVAKPVTIKWTVERGLTVSNPVGNYSKALDGAWKPLAGSFVRWKFTVDIDKTYCDVADYYLPLGYAEFILATDPLVLHQEYFGSAKQTLRSKKCTVRYTALQVSDGTRPYPLDKWVMSWRIDDGAGNLDNHFGWQSDARSVTSSVGHDYDVTSSVRQVGHVFLLTTPVSEVNVS